MEYFLGVDIGGTKTHALIADENGAVLGFAQGGPGNWEGVGYEGFTRVLLATVGKALEMAGLEVEQLAGVGMGIGGYDWPSQRQPHLEAIRPLGLRCPLEIVNDAVLGILAGAEDGWGVSVVAGTGCNCRGWNKDRTREGRVVGGHGEWSGEYAGGYDIVARAMRAIVFEWVKRGPKTALTPAFIERLGAKDLDDLVEGVYLGWYPFDPSLVLLTFEVARQGDPQALEVVRWAGEELGMMAVSVIRQLELEEEAFDVVLIGSLYKGHPLLTETLAETVHRVAPRARLKRLEAPPVVGGVLLGMEVAGRRDYSIRPALIETVRGLAPQLVSA